MKRESIQRFELSGLLLQYDFSAGTLLCRTLEEGKNLWIRKIEGGGSIHDAAEDEGHIYVAVGSGERSGEFLALDKITGLTDWSIPGKAMMFRIFSEALFLIFVDEEESFFLLKVSSADGSKIWHHRVNNRLYHYRINMESVFLEYSDGTMETLDNGSGLLRNRV